MRTRKSGDLVTCGTGRADSVPLKSSKRVTKIDPWVRLQELLKLLPQARAANIPMPIDQHVYAFLRQCAIATLERERWAGTSPIPYIKINGSVRYDLKDALDSLKS